MANFSKYVCYVDESGDATWDAAPEFPLLCVNFCLFRKDYYLDVLMPAFNRLKFKYWGSDNIVLHERDLRKPDKVKDPALRSKYQRLTGPLRTEFFDELTAFMEAAEFSSFAVLIDKEAVPRKYHAFDPYHIALSRGFRQIIDFLRATDPNELDHELHVVFEKRGHNDDVSLSTAYQQILLQGSLLGPMPGYDFRKFRLEMMDKKSNSTGLQIADLTARPIGNHYLHGKGLRANVDRRSADIILDKLMLCDGKLCVPRAYDIFHQALKS